MGRANGSWSPIYGQAWAHKKTAAASAWLVENGRRITVAVAPFLILGWLNRLCLWCLANSEHGSLAGLSAARVATIAWPEAIEGGLTAQKAGESILGALRVGGFIEGDPAQIHDFKEHHAGILSFRRTHLDADHQREAGRKSAEARRAKTGTAQPNHAPNHDGPTAPNHPPNHDGSNHDSSNHPEPSDRTVPYRTEPAAAAAAALVAEIRSRIRWHGTDDPIRTALDDFAAAGMSPEAIRTAIDQHANVGDRPLTLRDAILDARRKAPKRAERPPSEPCIDCRKAPCLPGRALCAACATPARERATTPAEPAAAAPEAPERGYAVPPHVVGCSPLRPSWRAVGRPGPRRRWPLDDED